MQMGVKGNTGGQAPAGNAFGQPGGFGAPAQSSPFGGSSLFGGAVCSFSLLTFSFLESRIRLFWRVCVYPSANTFLLQSLL